MNVSKSAIVWGVGGIAVGVIAAWVVFFVCPFGQKYRRPVYQNMMGYTEQRVAQNSATSTNPSIVLKPTSTVTNIELYKQWAYPANSKVFVEQFDKVDTVGVEYPEYDNADLLSSLIVGGKNLHTYNEGALNLAAYTREYLISLERDFARYTQANNNGDFYAAYVTHLSDGIDVASGKVGLKRSGSPGIALLRVNGRVYELENPPRIFNRSATGAGVYSCLASLKNKEILWTCFDGFDANKTSGEMEALMIETRYSLTGKKIATREYTE